MTCYFRHLQEIFEKAGIRVTSENKRDFDKVIHDIAGVEFKSCSVTWREVKEQIAENEGVFVLKLKENWSR